MAHGQCECIALGAGGGHSTSLEGEGGCTELEDAATRLALASARPRTLSGTDLPHGLSPAGGQPLALLPASTFARDRGRGGVYPGPCWGAGASTPGPLPFPIKKATSGLSGRTRLRKWASGWPPGGRAAGRGRRRNPGLGAPGARCAARLAAEPRRRPRPCGGLAPRCWGKGAGAPS